MGFWGFGVLGFCILDDFFRFSKKLGFRVFLVHPTVDKRNIIAQEQLLLKTHHILGTYYLLLVKL